MRNEPISFEERLQRIDGIKQGGSQGKPSTATEVTDLMMQEVAEVWHTPDREPYATFTSPEGVVSHHPIHSADFAERAQQLYYEKTKRAAPTDAIKTAVATIAAVGKFDGRERKVYSRIAHEEGVIWIDLGDDSWRVIRIDRHGWNLVASANVPVAFHRSKASRPLPMPAHGGSLEDLRALFSMSDGDWRLIVAWLIGVFQRDGARALLELLGQQGSGKSTLARFLVRMTDPTSIPGRSLPKDEESLLIAVQHRAVLGFDNVSSISPDMADAWCRLSTGGGFGKRKLYSDQEEVLIQAQIPILWTSIVPIAATRPDLQERTVTVFLEALGEEDYRSERELEATFEALLPGLAGALYDVISVALRNADTGRLDRRPRLADFAEWVESAAPALKWSPGSFASAMQASRLAASAEAVDSSLVARMLQRLTREMPEWHGTISELYDLLKGMADEGTHWQNDFPANSTQLGRLLRRLESPLEDTGVGLKFGRDRHSRFTTVYRTPKPPSVLETEL